MNRTEKLVRKCFCRGDISLMIGSWRLYARAARKFGKAEQAEKNKRYNDIPLVCLMNRNSKRKG